MAYPAPVPTRFPKGSTNVDPRHPFYRMPGQDPVRAHLFSSDFDTYASADWTTSGAGTPTFALVSADGGILQITTTNANNDSAFIQKTPGMMTLVAGQQAWFRVALNISNVTEPVLFAGLVNAGATAFSPTDGFWFSKATATTNLVFNYLTAAMSGAATATISGLPATYPTYENPSATNAFWPITNGAQFSMAAYYDGNTTLTYYYNDVAVGDIQINTTANPLPLGTLILAPAVGIQTKSTTARNSQIDFLQAGKSRY